MNPGSQKIRILAVDDHQLLRDGIAAVIGEQPDMQLVAEATNGREAVEQFRKQRPDVVLMDLQMPDMDGVDATRAICSEFPHARIVVLTLYRGDVQALRAFEAGASGYLLKSMLRHDLLETIRLVHAGKRRIPPEIALEIAQHATADTLSEREVEVLRHVAAGESNKQIAANLGIGEETAKAHVRSILDKLGVDDRTHAVTVALKRGIISL